MVFDASSLNRIAQRELPPFKLEEQLAELAQFAGDSEAKLIFTAAADNAVVQFGEIISTLAIDGAADFLNHHQSQRSENTPWDVELDGDRMGFYSQTPEQALQKTLHLCYQVALLRLARENGASESEMDQLAKDLDQEESWDYARTRNRLLHQLR